jgi:hypothetical protein
MRYLAIKYPSLKTNMPPKSVRKVRKRSTKRRKRNTVKKLTSAQQRDLARLPKKELTKLAGFAGLTEIEAKAPVLTKEVIADNLSRSAKISQLVKVLGVGALGLAALGGTTVLRRKWHERQISKARVAPGKRSAFGFRRRGTISEPSQLEAKMRKEQRTEELTRHPYSPATYFL